MYELTSAAFQQWLEGYRTAWESRDPAAAAALFTAGAEYYWTPFDPPQRGKGEIAQAWQQAVSGQRDVSFSHELLAARGNKGIARWRCSFTAVPAETKVRLDGILVAEFESAGQCTVFREWWHSATPAA